MQPTNTQRPYFYTLKQIITFFNPYTIKHPQFSHDYRKRHCFSGSSTTLIPTAQETRQRDFFGPCP